MGNHQKENNHNANRNKKEKVKTRKMRRQEEMRKNGGACQMDDGMKQMLIRYINMLTSSGEPYFILDPTMGLLSAALQDVEEMPMEILDATRCISVKRYMLVLNRFRIVYSEAIEEHSKVMGLFVLVERGRCSNVTKVRNIEKFGA